MLSNTTADLIEFYTDKISIMGQSAVHLKLFTEILNRLVTLYEKERLDL